MSQGFLSGKTALVTGSTSGIGLGIAQALARQGARIVVNGFGDVDGARQAIESLGVETLYHGADMSKVAQIEDMMASIERQWGRVDILVNNAGIQHVAPIDEFPDAKWEAILAINLSSAFYSTKAVLPGMKARKWGRIINIASVHGLIGSTKKVAYTAAKHGLIGMSKVVALENATHGVTCNAICPGWVLTPLVEKQIDAIAKEKNISFEDAKIELLSEKQPSLQFATPDQLGGLAVFLATDDASQITGVPLPMDGGWTAR
jgi:3-hydroxybutyrate dehydrogenase